MIDPIEMTRQLIRFETVSNTSNEKVGYFIADQLRELGCRIEFVEYLDPHGTQKVNVIGVCGPKTASAKPGLAYFCHSDVVPVDAWNGPTKSPWQAEIHDSKLYGRGSCDMKGSAAAMLAALSRLDVSKFQAPFYFVCTADEEVHYRGAEQVVQNSRLYKAMVASQTPVLIGEPTRLRVVHAHKGICGLEIISVGASAHSGTRDGLNANLAMIPFLQDLKEIYEETESDETWMNHEFHPPTLSLNIGINDHTKAVNIKPGRSVCTVFYRPLPKVDDLQLCNRIHAVAEKHGLVFKVQSRCDAVYTDPSSNFVQQALAIAGLDDSETVAYGTDAGRLPELPAKIVCGPGDIAQAHTDNEWVEIEQLQRGVDLFAKFVTHHCLAEMLP